MGRLEGLTEDHQAGLLVGRTEGLKEVQKVGRTEDRWADLLVDLLVDRSGAPKVARTVVQMANRSEVRTADRLVAQKVARTAGRLGGQKEEQMEGWPEGLAPRRQERVSAVLQARSQAPLASA